MTENQYKVILTDHLYLMMKESYFNPVESAMFQDNNSTRGHRDLLNSLINKKIMSFISYGLRNSQRLQMCKETSLLSLYHY